MLKAFTYDILEDRPYNDNVVNNIEHPHQEGNKKRSDTQRSNPYSSNTHSDGRSRSPYGSTH